MSDNAKVFEIDQANYTTFNALKKALNREVIENFQSVSSLAGNKYNRNNTSIVSQYGFEKKGVFMGLFVSDVSPPTHASASQEIQLKLKEVLFNEAMGPTFFVTLHSIFAEEWKNNLAVQPTRRSINKKLKLLIIFQNPSCQISETGEINFHLTGNSDDVWVKLKNYFSSPKEARFLQYISLTVAADKKASNFHSYAVVHDILKAPCVRKVNKGYGLYLVVDQSCYDENMVKVRDFLFHVFSSSIEKFPKIIKGDVIRMQNASAEFKPGGRLEVDFRIFHETNLVVFPSSDRERPRCLASYFTFSEDDIAQVERLKSWALERFKQAPTPLEPKITTLSKMNQDFPQSCNKSRLERKETPLNKQMLGSDLVHPTEIVLLKEQLTNEQGTKSQPSKVHYAKEKINEEQFSNEEGDATKEQPPNKDQQIPVIASKQQARNMEYSKESDEEDLKLGHSYNSQIEIEEYVSLLEIAEDPSPQIVVDTSAEADGRQIESQIDQIKSSGECSTDTEMRAIWSADFALSSPPIQSAVSEVIQRDSRLLHQSVNSKVEDGVVPSPVLNQASPHSQELAPLEEMNFNLAFGSTQEEAKAQQPATEIQSPDSKYPVTNLPVAIIAEEDYLSTRPPFLAVKEVLEIKSQCSALGDCSEGENQLNVNTESPYCHTDQNEGNDIIVSRNNESELCKVSDIEMTEQCQRRGNGSSSVMEIEIDCDEISEESVNDSVVFLDLTFEDLEEMFCAVEERVKVQTRKNFFESNFSEMVSIRPGERFNLVAHITCLSPKESKEDKVELKDLLVAFCDDCKHEWQYHHFRKYSQLRNRPKVSADFEDEECDWVINYLCSEENHDRNMQILLESDNPNMDNFEDDENVIIDRSFSFICPKCVIPSVLKPSFFFWLHATHKSECLHILASGRHADYFLGTKADHVLRSPEIWKRAELRLEKLVKTNQVLTLSLLRYEANPEEIYLENTKNVFSDNHLLPW